MALADDFQQVLDSLPGDWTDIVCDLRIADEDHYVDAAVLMTQVNAQPYSKAEWHFRINVAHSFGHAAAAETVKGTLALLDEQGIAGELIVRDVHEGRAEVVQMWGRPESVRREFRPAARSSTLALGASAGFGSPGREGRDHRAELVRDHPRAVDLRPGPGALVGAVGLDQAEALAPADHRDHQQRAFAEREQQLDLARVAVGVADHHLHRLLVAQHLGAQRVVVDREDRLVGGLAGLGQGLEHALVRVPGREADLRGAELGGDQRQRAARGPLAFARPRAGR